MSRSAARNEGLACVLLAAGGSRRLGAPKQLVRRKTVPLLRRTIACAQHALPGVPLVVVLGAQALRLRSLVRRAAPRAVVAHNPRWHEGMATSLHAGMAAIPPRTQALLVVLVDQPNIDARALLRLVTAWRTHPGRPAAAAYLDRLGVPAILPRRLWRTLNEVSGDSGARALLRGTANVTRVPMPEAELDIDTREDLERLR